MILPIIEIKNISKKYNLGAAQPYYTLRDTIAGVIKYLLARVNSNFESKIKLDKGEFWALKNVSFNILPGEIIGIIGRNGAGKTTLLKILSQITYPTEGEVILRGRVSSLLGVGTGFNPELTGRENIYLNGALLGMKKKEINDKFNEIIEFSEMDEFIDTPVKFYSSGMYVRLAFSIAAHLDPEILIIDEVLAVGDAKFQQKCLGKMDSVTKEGRTVIFVSHSVGSILRMVDKCIRIDKGRIIETGDPKVVVDHYLEENFPKTGTKKYEDDSRKDVQITSVSIIDTSGKINSSLDISDDITIEYEILIKKGSGIKLVSTIEMVNGTQLISMNSSELKDFPDKWAKGRYKIKLIYPKNILNIGYYVLRSNAFPLYEKAKREQWGEGLSFEITESKKSGLAATIDKKRAILSLIPKFLYNKI